ncbi:MAG TPA: 1-(5-phosphoribosyl)-5-[(5-phosphoribosylamino)methylideneamino]imidazole-4-carboxamide isomerase [Acidimicrobiales bacterium]|nr:1-(5-phosphoribosyl)-5-[(5-phosphoribosylamino)methylideneamino]imidazole-4-carboxamide isomerase [Acidimicrobiales bacterium]
MHLYPAVDLRGGRVVRLYQGDFDKETAYGMDPVAVAEGYAAAGAPWIHVVDLDAARTGTPENRPVIAAIADAVNVKVQASGGVRDQASAEEVLACGVDRVVLGTAAVENPELVCDLAGHHQVAVGLDVRGREVAVRGWTEGSGVDLFDLLARYADSGVAAVVVTDISRDSTLEGPNLEGLAAVLDATDIPVIASGGVGALPDLEALATLEASGRRLEGAIVGKALYEGKFTVEEAIAACGR